MYDPSTANLIRGTPELPELDRDSLPDVLSRAFAEIAAVRVSLREDAFDRQSLDATQAFALRLASTNEALVAITPSREDREAAAFVSATAHQLVQQTHAFEAGYQHRTFLTSQSISSDIAAMLLFLIGHSTADATEVASSIEFKEQREIESSLIRTLAWLATGEIGKITSRELPEKSETIRGQAADRASDALYYLLLEGVRALAFNLQGRSIKQIADPIAVFKKVQSLSAPQTIPLNTKYEVGPIVVFPGPFHLASLLASAGAALIDNAVVSIKPPNDLDNDRWLEAMKVMAKDRPYLWANHRDAIKQGYLSYGTSSVVGFPTGAGKSTLSQIKISTVLLAGKKAIFLAPTHALVDQTARDLRGAFPRASVQGERADEYGFLSEGDELPDVLVMTPEACLLMGHITPNTFEEVGLLIFDECHLIHPRNARDRRSVDAMLCIINFVRIAPTADLILLSAMMKNTTEIADWISGLTGRTTLDLAMTWKPTRQLRGCIVYEQSRLIELQRLLDSEKIKKTTVGVPAALRKQLTAQPFGFFSVQQTWASRERKDYAFLSFHREMLELGANPSWKLTPNSGVVASKIATSAADAGIKTLIFSQTIPNAVSIANKASQALSDPSCTLNESELRWFEIAVDEMGGSDQLFIDIKEGELISRATSHHGQLLPEERHLVESLYKRPDGISVLAATPTLGQGMNLPSELVIIADDSRYDESSGQRNVLDAQDLLNAAGRAGRAGKNATGMVVIVPGKLVGLDEAESKIGNRWSKLREVFGQTDQCLIIDDPITAVLDRIHDQVEDIGDIDRYVISRLISSIQDNGSAAETTLNLGHTLTAYRKKMVGDTEWLNSRTDAALAFLRNENTNDDYRLEIRDLASTLGMPEDIVALLRNDVMTAPLGNTASVTEWCDWFFTWMNKNSNATMRLMRTEDLEQLFGSQFKSLTTDAERVTYALPFLQKSLTKWMHGESLRTIQESLSQKARDKKKSVSARKFVLRIVPSLAHIFGASLLILRLNENQEDGTDYEPYPGVSQLNLCVRRGLVSIDMSAYYQCVRTTQLSRRETHRQFSELQNYLSPRSDSEHWNVTEQRIKDAILDMKQANE